VKWIPVHRPDHAENKVSNANQQREQNGSLVSAMSGVSTKEVTADEEGMRLDRWFGVHFPQFSHGQLQKCLRKGQIRVDGGRVKANARLQQGQVVRVPPPPEASQAERPRERYVSARDREFAEQLLIYKDEHFLAVNKPPGLAVQGGSGQVRHLDGLLDGLQFRAPERPKLVHRIDKDTSGVLLLARSRRAAAQFGGLLQKRDTIKLYWGLVTGVPRPRSGQIDLQLIKAGGPNGERMQPAEDGTPGALSAVSRYQVMVSAGQDFSSVALSPVTGRTHQLRVHMNAIGHPIVGDGKYGGRTAHPGGQLSEKLHLHARQICFIHPVTGKPVKISAPLPEHMAKTWDLFGFDKDDPSNPFDPDDCGDVCRVK
jgi:23S rRNA pseudouridine955/2504/2580 synthase